MKILDNTTVDEIWGITVTTDDKTIQYCITENLLLLEVSKKYFNPYLMKESPSTQYISHFKYISQL